MRAFIDLLRESDQFAADAGKDTVGEAEVQAAIDAQIRRGDRIYRRLQEEIGRKTIRIETDGDQVGQINGLSVISLGNLAFGTPTRITARVRLGRGEVVDIEREVELGGPLHSKGVLILSGFLGGRFGGNRPLSLNASLVFEQSYGGVDGDSASAAELFALLSALGGRADKAILRGDRLGRSARPDPGDRRGQREDRGVFRQPAGSPVSPATRA